MRVLIFGSRTYPTSQFFFDVLNELHKEYGFTKIIEGEAPGADTLAKVFGMVYHVPVEPYPADWKKYGRAAGPIRNKQMLDEGRPDLAIGFIDKPLPLSKGSRNMCIQARKAGIDVLLYTRIA